MITTAIACLRFRRVEGRSANRSSCRGLHRAATLLLGGVLWTFAIPAHAFLGIGDISFDPQSYGELVSIYDTLQQSQETLGRELQSLRRLEALTAHANQTTTRMRDPAYHALAAGLAANPADAAAGLNALAARIARQAAQDPGAAVSFRIERRQIDALRGLERLQRAAVRNVALSATDLGGRDSARVTAESAATLAALAAAAQERQRAAALEHLQAQVDERGLVAASGGIYRTLGSAP